MTLLNFLYQLNLRIPVKFSILRSYFQIEQYKSNFTLNIPVIRMAIVANNMNIDFFLIWNIVKLLDVDFPGVGNK